MSLLTIIQDVCDRLSLQRPSAVISSTDQVVRTLLGLAQQEGKEMARRATWQALTTEKTFTSVAAELQPSTIPTDFDYYLPDTFFNRTSRRKVEGPLTAEEWQRTKATLVVRVNPCFRLQGGNLYITPVPSAGDTFAYEYLSKNWCQSNASVGQSAWAADSDTALIDEELHKLGIIWRFKKSKGFDYGEDFASYERSLTQAMVRDGAKPRIYTDGMGRERVPNAPQVPETLVFS